MTGGTSEASLQTVLRKQSIRPRASLFPADISCRIVDSFPDLLALHTPLFSEGIRIGTIRLFQIACLFQDGKCSVNGFSCPEICIQSSGAHHCAAARTWPNCYDDLW